MKPTAATATPPGPDAPLLAISPAPPEASALRRWRADWNQVWAVAQVVVLELKRRKDFYVLFFLTALLTLAFTTANFFNQDNIVRYLKEICLLLIWISSLVIAVTTAGRQIPAEREQRTLLPLLAKPLTRTRFVLGKFLGCWLATGLALAVFYAFFALVSGLREQAWPLASYLQALSLHWFMLGIVVALSLLGSIVFAAPSSNNTIVLTVALGILLLGRHLNKVALQLGEPLQSLVYAVYYLIPHLEFFDVRNLVVHNWGTISWWVWVQALVYAVAYMALFLTATCLLFRRKPVTA